MSLIPSAVQGAPGDNYFPLMDRGVARGLSLFPLEDGFGNDAATLSINNGGVTDPSGHAMNVVHYVARKLGGGLTPGLYQVFMYGPDVSAGQPIGYLMEGAGTGNGNAVLGFNNAGPLDATRMGKITGTGAPQTVPVPSITAASLVRLSFVAGTPAVADPAVTIVADTSFSVTLPAGAVYLYEVIA